MAAEEVLRTVLGQIDDYMSRKQLLRVKFLACSLVPHGTVEEVQDVYGLLEILKLYCNGEEPVAIAVLCRILEVAGFSESKRKRLSVLKKLFAFASQESSLQSVAPNLRFYEFLYVVAGKIGDGKTLRKILQHVDEDKVGMHPNDIKTSIQLLQRLVHREKIRPNDVEELLSLLSDSGEDSIVEFIVNCRTERHSETASNPETESDAVYMIQTLSVTLTKSMCIVDRKQGQSLDDATELHKMAAPLDATDSDYYYGLIIQQRSSEPRPFFRRKFSRKQYSIISCVFLSLLALLLVSICLTLLLALLKHYQLKDTTNVYTNVTFEAFQHSFDTWYYDEAQITIKPLHPDTKYPTTANVHYCQTDCSSGEPTYQESGFYNFTYLARNTRQTTKRHFAKLSNGHDEYTVSLFMLKGSTMSFEIHAEFADSQPADILNVRLFVLLDLDECEEFRQDGTNSKAYHRKAYLGPFQNWSRDGETFRETLKAPKDSYYCGVWEMPGNTSFNCTTTLNVRYYTESIITQGNCSVSHTLKQTDNSKSISKTYPIANRGDVATQPINKNKACIFIYQSEEVYDFGPIAIELMLHNTPLNVGFVVSLACSIVLFILLCVFACFCVAAHVNRK